METLEIPEVLLQSLRLDCTEGPVPHRLNIIQRSSARDDLDRTGPQVIVDLEEFEDICTSEFLKERHECL